MVTHTSYFFPRRIYNKTRCVAYGSLNRFCLISTDEDLRDLIFFLRFQCNMFDIIIATHVQHTRRMNDMTHLIYYTLTLVLVQEYYCYARCKKKSQISNLNWQSTSWPFYTLMHDAQVRFTCQPYQLSKQHHKMNECSSSSTNYLIS